MPVRTRQYPTTDSESALRLRNCGSPGMSCESNALSRSATTDIDGMSISACTDEPPRHEAVAGRDLGRHQRGARVIPQRCDPFTVLGVRLARRRTLDPDSTQHGHAESANRDRVHRHVHDADLAFLSSGGRR
jgi:hypothetical protein